MPLRPFLALLALSACTLADPNTLEVTASPVDVSATQRGVIEARIAEQSREPEANRYRRWQGYALSNGDTAICGEVNVKNAYGGYVGYLVFYARLRGDRPLVVNWGENWDRANALACAQAEAGHLMVMPDPAAAG